MKENATLQESHEGGVCDTCKGRQAFWGTNPDLMDKINYYYGYWNGGAWHQSNSVSLAEAITAVKEMNDPARIHNAGMQRAAEMETELCGECGQLVNNERHFKGMVGVFCLNPDKLEGEK